MPNSGLAGFGGVARDDQGRWLGGFCGRLGFVATSSLTAERVESGEEVQHEKVDSHPDRVVIEECRRLLSELGIAMMHTLRQGNNCTDETRKNATRRRPRNTTSPPTFPTPTTSRGHGPRCIP
ncbi:hypothetical protein FXO38_34710 [Capsicum annuum]|nr:hypothetical protein FXO38_34710 [Capsicum annuum]